MAAAEAEQVALLSIHPRYAEAILAGDKQVEFRKTPLRDGVDEVLLYATSPVQRIVGGFRVAGVDCAVPATLWDRYRAVGGVGRAAFLEYYAGKDHGYAIRIASRHALDQPLPLDAVVSHGRPPQNLMYVERQQQPEPLNDTSEGLLAGISRATRDLLHGLLVTPTRWWQHLSGSVEA